MVKAKRPLTMQERIYQENLMGVGFPPEKNPNLSKEEVERRMVEFRKSLIEEYKDNPQSHAYEWANQPPEDLWEE